MTAIQEAISEFERKGQFEEQDNTNEWEYKQRVFFGKAIGWIGRTLLEELSLAGPADEDVQEIGSTLFLPLVFNGHSGRILLGPDQAALEFTVKIPEQQDKILSITLEMQQAHRYPKPVPANRAVLGGMFAALAAL